jgi:16S rRNA (adenine1518-N6/adenine1519-N6)-dimethyltransferase
MKRGARLGQHFLKNGAYAVRLAESVHAQPDDTILEIGPGHGALTSVLLQSGARVLAIEKDEVLAEELRHTFAEAAAHRLEIIEGDVRNFDPAAIEGAYVLAANIPYYITGEIIRQFLTASHQPRAIALLIQKEVAERIVARDGKESILSISVKAYGTPSIVAKVSKGNFSPPPSVDSAILLIESISKRRFDAVSEEHFFSVVRAGFAARRKTLSNTLAAAFGKDAATHALGTAGIPEATRAEDISLDQWLALARAITTSPSS